MYGASLVFMMLTLGGICMDKTEGYIYALTMGSEDESASKNNALRIEYMSFDDLLNKGYQYIAYIGMSYQFPTKRLGQHQSSKEWLNNGCKNEIAKVMNLPYAVSNKYLHMTVITDWSYSLEEWPEFDVKEKECILAVKEKFGNEPVFNTPAGLGFKQADYIKLKQGQKAPVEIDTCEVCKKAEAEIETRYALVCKDCLCEVVPEGYP
jgi:hypothetical protein